MKFFLIVIAGVLLILNSYAADTLATLELNVTQNEFHEGELLSGYMKVWPLANADLNSFKELLNKQLTNTLRVLDIETVQTSANNSDVVEVKLLLVVKKSMEFNSAINYRGEVIPVKAPDLKVVESQMPQDYIVLDQSLLSSHWLKITLLIIILGLTALAIWKRNSLTQFFKGLKPDPRKELVKKYRRIFEIASSREDFEAIYSSRREWMELLSIKAQAYDEFFMVMNEHQYKREWGDMELSEVKKIFDIIRGSFK